MRAQGNKRKAGEEDTGESRLSKTVRYLKALDKTENKKDAGSCEGDRN